MQNQLVYEFRKNSFERVKVELSNYKGIDVINIRVYYIADVAKDEWKPSPKGITMRADLIPELKEGIEKAFEEWQWQINKEN